ncbi:MAG: YjbH domain-containing protein, partial [Spongiibacter sp.]
MPWLLCPLAAAAQSNMNMQGMSGLFNVPDASVLEYGTAVLAHDRQVDGRFARPRTRNAAGNDMTISAGAFPHVEIVGRNVTTTTTTASSDLSFNIKLQLPWELIEGVDFAIGEMDLGGSVNEYDTQFGVVTAQLGGFRTTIGFG